MRRLLFALLAPALAFVIWSPVAFADGAQGRGAPSPVNAAIGDASWVAAHGHRPSEQAGEVERIRTHLLYVIEQLSAATPSALTDAQRARRHAALEGLREYAMAGVFPRRDAGDGYGERRPRFIDDRGVHCAVGEMIRRSGRGELARHIDARFEYAYVPDIESSQLGEWARSHGFTSRELAMIQPQYGSAPSKEQIRSDIERMKEHLILTCARRVEPEDSVIIKVHRKRGGRSDVSAGWFPSDFAECVRDELSKQSFGGGGAWSSPPEAFRLRMKLDMPPPEQLAKQRLQNIRFGGPSAACLPRPGAVPEQVAVELRSDKDGLEIDVATEPANDEVDECFEEKIRDQFRAFASGGHWNIELDRTLQREPMLTDDRLSNPIIGAGHQCAGEANQSSYTAHVRSDVEDQSFTVEIDDAAPEFAKCMEQAYNEVAVSNFSVSRNPPDGSYERYFRIVDAAEASIDFEIGVADPAICPDGGTQVSIEGTIGRRCEGRMIVPGREPEYR